jgi:hypothetical protein
MPHKGWLSVYPTFIGGALLGGDVMGGEIGKEVQTAVLERRTRVVAGRAGGRQSAAEGRSVP